MKAKVSFEVEIPDGVSPDDADTWLRFQLHELNVIENRNPLLSHHIDPSSEIKIEFER